jgi:GT2 family glycosyltransferase
VVVDNASGDGSLEVARAWTTEPRHHPVGIVANTSNRGFAGGVHDGLGAATPGWEAVWLVNVDALPAPDHLARLVAVLIADPTCAAVQGTLIRTHRGPDGIEVVDSTGIEATGARLFRDRDEAHPVTTLARPAGEVFGVTGACSLLRRAALEDVAWSGPGPVHRRILTEDLFAFFEDVELAWRLQRGGWRCRYEPAAEAHHERGGAGPRRSAVVEELNFANRLLVLRTCDGGRTAWRAGPQVAVTTVLKLGELAVTVPSALLPTLRRLRRGWAGASTRRRDLDDRARRTCDEVAGRWFVPFRWTPWIATWWHRVRGRAPGVAGGGR